VKNFAVILRDGFAVKVRPTHIWCHDWLMAGLDPFNLSDEAFESVMTAIDAEVRKQSKVVPGREVLALMEFMKRFQIELQMGHPLEERIVNWFKRVYGERLNTDFSRGYSAVMIRGDLYRLRFLTFFGTAAIVSRPDWIGRRLSRQERNGQILPVINLLERHIEGMTPDHAHRLTIQECNELTNAYSRMERAFTALETAETGANVHITEIVDDLKASASHLLSEPPNYGFSRWSSLQATEKIIKSYIVCKGSVPGRHHSLSKLCQAAYNLGLPLQESAKIAAIQCSAEVRYDSTRATKEEALAAHYASLEICATVAALLPHA
jgi:hypothetical protein